jgi:hypothetical protein
MLHELLAPGRYELRLGLIDPIGDRPIAMPLRGRAEDGTYAVGHVTVGGG